MTRLLYEKYVPADDLLAPLFAAMPPELPLREAALMASAGRQPASSPSGHPPAQLRSE